MTVLGTVDVETRQAGRSKPGSGLPASRSAIQRRWEDLQGRVTSRINRQGFLDEGLETALKG